MAWPGTHEELIRAVAKGGQQAIRAAFHANRLTDAEEHACLTDMDAVFAAGGDILAFGEWIQGWALGARRKRAAGWRGR